MFVHNIKLVCSTAAVFFVWALLTFSKLPEDDQDVDRNMSQSRQFVRKKNIIFALVHLLVLLREFVIILSLMAQYNKFCMTRNYV